MFFFFSAYHFSLNNFIFSLCVGILIIHICIHLPNLHINPMLIFPINNSMNFCHPLLNFLLQSGIEGSKKLWGENGNKNTRTYTYTCILIHRYRYYKLYSLVQLEKKHTTFPSYSNQQNCAIKYSVNIQNDHLVFLLLFDNFWFFYFCFCGFFILLSARAVNVPCQIWK